MKISVMYKYYNQNWISSYKEKVLFTLLRPAGMGIMVDLLEK